ncbi:zinc ribbon domain-containing protein [Chryseobacterium ginsengisoli]
MENNITCFSCDFTLDKQYKFCPSCGTNVKCKNCDTLLVKGAKFCFNCGTSIYEENKIIVNENINTIKFKETKEEREYEVRFTNETASQVTSVVAGMIPNNSKIFKSNITDSNLVEYEFVDEVKDDSNESENVISFNSDESGEINNPLPVDVSEKGFSFPHINDLAIKYTNFSEREWILIYAFYESGFGKNQFTRDGVYQSYKDARYTVIRRKNFAGNWTKLFKENFSTVKDNNLILTSIGIENAKKLLTNHSEKLSKPTNKVKSNVQNKTSKSVAQQSIKLEEFDMYVKDGLESLINKVNPNSTKEYILCIGYYINHILKKEYFSDGNIDFAFKSLKLPKRPTGLRQVIKNIKYRDFWVEIVESQYWKLSRKGELEFEKMLGNAN